jgi:hypothetical protein
MNPDLQVERPQLAVPENQPVPGAVNYGLRSPEQMPGAEGGNVASQAAPTQALMPAQQMPIAGATTTSIPGGAPGPVPAATPATADDTDLIEKEWVIKAKQIVEQTRDDPYRQNNEMHKIKAEYIKKRYNKEIKLVDN